MGSLCIIDIAVVGYVECNVIKMTYKFTIVCSHFDLFIDSPVSTVQRRQIEQHLSFVIQLFFNDSHEIHVFVLLLLI